MNEEVSLKSIFIHMLNIATRVTTLIFLFSTVFTFFLSGPNSIYSIKDIIGILIIGLLSGLFFFIFYIPKNPGKKLMFFLQLIYFLLINATVFISGYLLKWMENLNSFSFIYLEIMILGIYIIVRVSFFLLDYREATKLNKLLQKRKNDQTSENRK